MGVEAEFVDGVIAHHPLADELRDRADPLGEFGGSLVGARRAGDTATNMIDVTNDRGDLLGRSARAAVREQRRMAA